MKKILFSLLCSLQLTGSFAQNGFFLQPTAGIGLTNILRTDEDGKMRSKDYLLGFDAGVLAGLRSGRWVYTTGLEYLSTGTKLSVTMTDALGNPIGNTYLDYRYSHLMLPLMAGYSFHMGRKLSLTPAAGVGIAYNISETDKFELTGHKEHISASDFNNFYNRVSCFGLLQVELAWRLSQNLSITCAPSFDYMLTNMGKPDYFQPEHYKQHNYALLLNFGVKWQSAKTKNATKEVPTAK